MYDILLWENCVRVPLASASHVSSLAMYHPFGLTTMFSSSVGVSISLSRFTWYDGVPVSCGSSFVSYVLKAGFCDCTLNFTCTMFCFMLAPCLY